MHQRSRTSLLSYLDDAILAVCAVAVIVYMLAFMHC